MTPIMTLSSIEADLRQPFPVEEIKLLPKAPTRNEQGQWSCLALPYADKRTYEDRLNTLAFAQWSTPATEPIVAGNKLIVTVTVVLCGVARTDLGEAFLSGLTRQGEVREEENSATQAYSQAFRRACAQFGLGRYLYDLPRLWVPYDPKRHLIALSPEAQVQAIEQLYHQTGLQRVPKQRSSHREGSSAATSARTERSASNEAPAEPISERQLSWIQQQVCNDTHRIERICAAYQVQTLENLTFIQARQIMNRLQAQARQGSSTPQAALTARR
ncbi:MAG TPA: Rad52/Rad22 family DNA repair protein [Ktedonosporobacter sp.]|nr:Rad52/Rad22 family DNA repair protein [Ktedonosporobacter sp.]